MFEPSTGELVLPVLQVGEEQQFFARFSLLSNNPYRWQLTESSPVSAVSRVAAEFQPASSSLWVPEIVIDEQLYSLSFTVETDCAEGVCLSPMLESVQELGRSGGEIFTSVASGNSTYTCSTCHAISEDDGFAADGLRRPGNPLLNVTKRPHYKGGELSSLLAAINICRTEWMNTSAWEESNQEWTNLMNWLDDQATVDTTNAIELSIVPPVESLEGGDAQNGQGLFNKRCSVCHGDDGLGTNLAPKISNTGLQADYIAQRIRHSGRSNSAVYPSLTGGIMPFWTVDRLNNEDMLDIIAYLASGETDPVATAGDTDSDTTTDDTDSVVMTDDSDPVAMTDDSDPVAMTDDSDPVTMTDDTDPVTMTDNSDTSVSSCGSDHVKVGQTATLSMLFHQVAGTAVIIDNCTIELRNFSFDGGGIDVQIYAGNNSQFHPSQGGFSIKSGLVGTAYDNGTLTFTLPDGVTLNDFDSISIWCVPVGVSFGDGQFSSPQPLVNLDIDTDGVSDTSSY